ncbi:A disintegrin and metalloproteinase with thrombospondin motifs 16 isoform X1 [Pygocentrus nattereri]|uniref:A disintegrin and metalloproteinase with thrombospondin motifs 16 isoform X1 n=1 Tax=Pygocentrus nattereri TaxID=42514 RepID=UPI0018913182|nr:A disintegrin and metalloproteinase with thrombospondin motifs 16 isoform X1 [Pygocentrus nattereri]
MAYMHFAPNRRICTPTFLALTLIFILGSKSTQSSSPNPGAHGADRAPSSLLESLNLPSNTEYEIVAPYEVDHKGQYISHAVAHHHRRRRSVEGQVTDLTAMAHFRLHGLGQDFHLELLPSSSLFAPGFTVQTLGKNGTKSLQPYAQDDFCFYQGTLRSMVNSSVALSVCAGMSGLIRTQEADYFLRPLLQHHLRMKNYTAPEHHQPHILYKRHATPHIARETTRDPAEPSRKDKEGDGLYRDTKRLRRSTHMQMVPGDHLHRHHSHHNNYRHGTRQRQHYCGRRKKYMPKPPEEDIHILPDEYKFLPRGKRAVIFQTPSKQKLNVETLVVVDQKMMENHGRENITTYVLTVLNMVSTLFKDGTIGGDINIVIVGLILLHEEQEGLVVSHHADHTLNSFCQWQSGLAGREGRRHDHAILLTGLDICSWKNEPCDTLGFAPISGMCSKYRSCTINEDTGLGLAFTIAHESGHNFGMVHDGEGNVCKKSVGNIMSPTLAGHNGLFSWSSCSRQYLTRFLSTAQATCLSDEPKAVEEYKYPEKLPGELYDTDTQCKWQFGEKAKLCTLDFKKDICKALWCHRVGRKCETKFMPAAEGSVCGPEMWCRRGQCVKQGEEGPQPVHGQWSSWSSWSSCSRTCESGVTYRERHCNSPRPVYGGRFCEGPSRSYKLCNTENCPQGSVDFRAAQCTEFNSKPFRGWYYSWKPYTRVDDQDVCKLYCFAEGYDFFFALSSKVQDGTLCTQDSSNVCIDGMCERVGCDRVLGSTAVLDMCGVCSGNNSTCKIYKGQYTKQHYANQYYGVVTIPPGARSIHVVELNTSSSYLALRNSNRKYYLNGRWTVDWPGRHSIAGTVFDYKRPYNRPESLTSTGPINETLVVEILLQGVNPGVRWEYTLAKADTERETQPKHSYTWATIRSQCSATCARGEMSVKAACYKDLRVQVNTSYCNPRSRPSTGVMPCNTQPCPPSWSVGDWSVCSRTCGSGEQSRQVQCVRRTSPTQMDVVTDTHCALPPPARRQPCNTHTCPPTWSTGPWSQCSRKCGKGVRKRTVMCLSSASGSRVLPDSSCVLLPRPHSQESCMLKRCQKQHRAQWVLSSWQQCSVTCGKGVQVRVLKCVEKDTVGKHRDLALKKCQHLPKPSAELQRACVQPDCPSIPRLHRPDWYNSPWSQCTVSCGGGIQVRSVQCLINGRPSSGCSSQMKPAMSQACSTAFCPQQQPQGAVCKDSFNWCYLVPQHGVCNHKFYGKQCCRSCSHTNL